MSDTPFVAQTPNYAARVHESFGRQGAMQTLGARLGHVLPGAVDIELDWAAGLTQQHGFLHAGWWRRLWILPVDMQDSL